jgi:hypothetical protein
MPATTWKALIRLPNGNQQEVRVTANSQINARQMIEANTRGLPFSSVSMKSI